MYKEIDTTGSDANHGSATNRQFEKEMEVFPENVDILIPYVNYALISVYSILFMMKPSVMGRSGAGKSTVCINQSARYTGLVIRLPYQFINRVLKGGYGQNLKPEQLMKTEVTLKRCTTVIGEAALKADSKGRRIILVDTPGFDGDDNDFDANHNPVSTVANWLKDVIVIGTTKWDKETANGVKANEVRSFFQIVKGAKFVTKESTAKDIVAQALEGFSSSANLQIQLEMVRDQKAFSGTAAGVYYNTQQLRNISKTLPLTLNKEIRERLERRKKELEKSLKSAGKTDWFPQTVGQSFELLALAAGSSSSNFLALR
ncbi:hypothetical protein CVT25_000443 [Psilocybe cyanescens]|uniref:G domain-containing protein n=1 Tax=Psilocybe cyanescens TaxID=93625 RepID=A0A409XM16_PSICY|nr:hypothetical protein CVT25_000443 [Psilocybe cyanescens]